MAREPSLDTFRGALGRGSRLAKRHVDDQAAIIYSWMVDELATAIENLKATAVTAAGAPPNASEIYDVDAAGARLMGRTEQGRVAMVNDSLEGVSAVWGASFDVTNPLINNLLLGMGQKITHIAEWQRAGVMNAVQHGYDQGYSIPRMAELMTDPSTGVNSMRRAAMIARTELTAATSGAGLAAAQTLEVSKFKQWLGTSDSRTRLDHSIVSGSVVKLRDAFNVNGHMMQHPGDPAGPAKEVVHCRCVLVYTDDPEGLARVPHHDEIQAAANNPEVIADDQRWLRKHRSELSRPERKRAAEMAQVQAEAAERERLATPGTHHRRDITRDEAWTRHGSPERTLDANGRSVTTPEHRPQAGSEFTLTTRAGHQVDVFAERHQLPVSEGGVIPDHLVQESMLRRVQELQAHLDALPAKLQREVKQIRLFSGKNPGDIYWQTMRQRDSWEAVATGGNGRINWWGGRKADFPTLAHEAGHTVAGGYRYTLPETRGVRNLGVPPSWWDQRTVWGGPPDGDKWMALTRADSKYQADAWYDAAQGSAMDIQSQMTMHPEWTLANRFDMKRTGGAVTGYGADSMAEDFAEACSLWAFDRRYGYVATAADGSRIRFKDIYPRRAGYLSRLLGGVK